MYQFLIIAYLFTSLLSGIISFHHQFLCDKVSFVLVCIFLGFWLYVLVCFLCNGSVFLM